MPDDDALRRAVDELTLRDHFACAALPGIMRRYERDGLDKMLHNSEDLLTITSFAYDVAEAMLEERARRADAD
jgi:hypothetical protein